MLKRSRPTKGVSFWKNLFNSAAEQQREQILVEISKLEKMSADLCQVLEPIVENMQKTKITHPSFYGCVQVLRAIDARKQLLESFDKSCSREDIFSLEKVINAPLVVQTNPVDSSAESNYGIESSNLCTFVDLFVKVLHEEQLAA